MNGRTAQAHAAIPRHRRRDAGARLHGQGARPRAEHDRLHDLAAAAAAAAGRAGRPAARGGRRRRPVGTASSVRRSDWRVLVEDPSIELFDNAGPNDLHAEPTLAALRAGKHVLCEKPLGRTAPESHEIWQAAEAAGVVHMCGFNYRFVPAVRLAREMIAAGEIGEVHSFRGAYLQDWLADPESPYVWRLDRQRAGSGALGDIGAHVVDLARFLVGEIAAVQRPCADGRAGAPGRPGRRRRHGRGAAGVRGAAPGLDHRVAAVPRQAQLADLRGQRHARLDRLRPRAAERAGRSTSTTRDRASAPRASGACW